MAIPTGPSSRPKRRHEESTAADAGVVAPASAAAVVAAPVAAAAAANPTPVAPAVARPSAPFAVFERQRQRDNVRQSGRIPSEVLRGDALISPAVLALSLAEFFELLYQDDQKWQELSVEELFRMRDQAAWPDLFGAGDPRHLFTEDMCRRGQFVPIGWSAEALSFATGRDDAGQDDLMRALDLLVQLPVTIYAVPSEAVEAGIVWLYRRPG